MSASTFISWSTVSKQEQWEAGFLGLKTGATSCTTAYSIHFFQIIICPNNSSLFQPSPPHLQAHHVHTNGIPQARWHLSALSEADGLFHVSQRSSVNSCISLCFTLYLKEHCLQKSKFNFHIASQQCMHEDKKKWQIMPMQVLGWSLGNHPYLSRSNWVLS